MSAINDTFWRFGAAIDRWMQRGVREIQRHGPRLLRGRVRGAAIAVVADCCALLLAAVGVNGLTVEFLFLSAIVVSAFFGGWTGGLTAWLLSGALIGIPITHDLLTLHGPLSQSGWSLVFRFLPMALLASWFSARSSRTNELLREAKQDLEDRVQRRTADLAAVVARMRQEIHRRKSTEEEIRNVAAHSRCILWRAELSSTADAGNQGRLPAWVVHVQDENAAQEVLPLQVEPNSSYYRAWTRARHPEDSLAISRRCLDAVLGGRASYSHEYRCLDRHGELRWLSEDVRIQTLAPGRWRLFGVTTDVTEGRRAAEALRASEERFSLFMEHLPGLAFIKDDAGRYVFMNRACEECLGIGHRAWSLKRGNEVHDPEVADRFVASELLVTALGRSLQSTEVLPGRDGKRFFVFNWFPIRYREGSPPLTGAVAIDITDRRQAEQELIAYQEKLRALSANASATEERERRQIAAALHDQIGSTLAAAQIRLQLLETTIDESSREQFADSARRTLPDVVGDLEQAIKHTRSLTCELSPPLLYEAGLEAALRWLGDQLFLRHGLRMTVEGDGSIESLPQELKVAIYQGARELLTNVVKHAHADQAVVRITRDENDRFVVAVIDDGVGLSATPSKRNNSFGLFNLRERMNYLGGALEFESQPGRGTRATITLDPRREREAPPAALESDAP